MFKKLIQNYKKHYSISYLDLADTAETSRIHAIVTAQLFLLFGLGNLIFFIAFYHNSLKEHLFHFIYFSIYFLSGLIGCIYLRWVKIVERERAYVLKTIPCYMYLHIFMWMGAFNLHFLNQPFNGVLVYCVTGFLTAFVFSLSPIYYFIGIILPLSVLIPGVYRTFGLTGALDLICCTLLMFVISLYKRRVEKKHIMFLKKQKQSLEAKTFGNFTLMYENKVIKFSRSKSEELLGYLIYKRGTSAKTKELISVLWGDHAASARYGGSFRNLIIDIRKTFAELEIQNFFIADYNNFRINPEVIRCDYYDFLSGDSHAIKSFVGEFMNQYSWAEDIAALLEQKSLKQ